MELMQQWSEWQARTPRNLKVIFLPYVCLSSLHLFIFISSLRQGMSGVVGSRDKQKIIEELQFMVPQYSAVNFNLKLLQSLLLLCDKFCPILYKNIVYPCIIVYLKDMFRTVIFIFLFYFWIQQDDAEEVLESGEEIYYPALQIGSEKSCPVVCIYVIIVYCD